MRLVGNWIGLSMFGISAMASAQTGSLADYLQSHAPTGAWIAIDPGHVTAKKAATDLTTFDRKAVPVGGLTAIVPRTMVTIDDSLAQTPDLYDGLPRDAKVLALMASLAPGEWRKLGGSGIGVGDLSGESRRILSSLLPRPLDWDRYHMHDGVVHMAETEHLTVPPNDVDRVRLRIYREISFYVHPQGKQGFFGLSTSEEDTSGAKDRTFGRLSDKTEADSAFGVGIRQTVGNQLKKGGIVFDAPAFNPAINLSGIKTVRDLLAAVSRVSGKSILADLRVAELPVANSGGSVRAGDALAAVALAVTGTYRPVGPGFALTSDLMGLGLRKARIDRWRRSLTSGVLSREAEWTKMVAAGGGLESVGYPDGALLKADRELQAKLDRPTETGLPDDVDANTLPSSFRDFLQRRQSEYAKINGSLAFDTDRVAVRSELKYAFVMPDGTEIGAGTVPTGRPPTTGPRSITNRPAPADSPRAYMPEGEKAASLILVAETADEAETAVRVAASYGFRELWLETHDQGLLQSVVAKAGRPVRLVIRPWTAIAGAKPADPDRTLWGDGARDVVARQLENPSIVRFTPPGAPTPQGRELLDPGAANRGTNFAGLAKTAGLAGLVVVDTQPEGYVPSGERTLMPEGDAEFGYTAAQRWAFLKDNGIDPIDIVFSRGYGTVELRQPFFPDNALASLTAINADGPRKEPEAQAKAPARWIAFRAQANQQATEALLNSLGNAPLLIGLRKADASGARWITPPLLPWHPGEPLPTSAVPDPNDPLTMLTVLGVEPIDRERLLRATFGHPERSHPERIILDLSAVPRAKWTIVLDRILKTRER